MSFWRKILGRQSKAGRYYPVQVKCARCGEIIETRVDLHNDLTADYDEQGRVRAYFVRKILQGSGRTRCFATIEVILRFDPRRQLVDREVHGGEFLE